VVLFELEKVLAVVAVVLFELEKVLAVVLFELEKLFLGY
jgi:hypothetical protein